MGILLLFSFKYLSEKQIFRRGKDDKERELWNSREIEWSNQRDSAWKTWGFPNQALFIHIGQSTMKLMNECARARLVGINDKQSGNNKQ